VSQNGVILITASQFVAHAGQAPKSSDKAEPSAREHKLQCRLLQSPLNSVVPNAPEVTSPKPLSAARIVALTVLFTSAAVYEAVHISAVTMAGVWVHLQTGLWIVQNHAFPRSGIFSQYSSLSWTDASWLFDLILGVAYQTFGLRALPIVLMALKIALGIVTFLLARAARASFWSAVALSAIAQYVITNLQPMPSAVSVVFVAVELILLLGYRRTGAVHKLFLLLVLFLFWANLDIQCVLGLLLLVLYWIGLAIEQTLRTETRPWITGSAEGLDLRKMALAAMLSLGVTFVTPYTIHLLPTAPGALYSETSFQYFGEMSAMSFRRPQDFALMLLVMAGFLSLGRRRALDPASVLVFIAAAALAFRVQRDAWLVVLLAIAIIPAGFPEMNCLPLLTMAPTWQRTAVAVLTALVFVVTGVLLPTQQVLMSKIGQEYPVKACDYIRANHLPQPLYNAYVWGSFLTWYLPEDPVVVDSRVELYGDEILNKHFDVASGKEKLEEDPGLLRCQTLLLEKQSAMARALVNFPALRAQFQLVYSDQVASVFLRVAGSR